MPVYTIASIAGSDGSFVVKKLLEQDNPNLGYDPITGFSIRKEKKEIWVILIMPHVCIDLR